MDANKYACPPLVVHQANADVPDAEYRPVWIFPLNIKIGNRPDALPLAEFIKTACNAHYQLVAALQYAKHRLEVAGEAKFNGVTMPMIKAALKAADVRTDIRAVGACSGAAEESAVVNSDFVSARMFLEAHPESFFESDEPVDRTTFAHAVDHLDDAIKLVDRLDKYARELAMHLWRDHYIKSAPEFGLCDDAYGVLTQIDNMLTGLIRAARQVVAPDGATLRNWLAMVHDNELSLGDRLQRLSVAFGTLLNGGKVDPTPYVVREPTFCACDAAEAMGRARPVVDGAVERDAARWRFMRSCCVRNEVPDDVANSTTEVQLDVAIDAAIAQEKAS